MAEIRPSKASDQDETERAFELLKECIGNHPEIEGAIWASAIFSLLIDSFVGSGLTYEEFCETWDKAKHFYKDWFRH